MTKQEEKELFKRVKKFVFEKYEGRSPHLVRTLHWAKELKPNIDISFQIAALSHDIERAFRGESKDEFYKKFGFCNSGHLKVHQNQGGEIMEKFLKKLNIENNIIKKVSRLIKHHEIGGDKGSNLLKDADSISFLEVNIDKFIKRIPDLGEKIVRDKFDWMYNRISSRKAKQIAKPFYEKAIKKLEQQK